MSEAKPAPEVPENPRTRRVRQLMLTTAIELLLKDGPHEVTAARIAEQAQVARTTVYRQWPDQRSILLATIHDLTKPTYASSFSGPLETDTRATLVNLRVRLVRKKTRSVFGALASFSAQDVAFRDAQELFINNLTQPMVEAFEAAVDRGEIAPDTDCDFEAALLTAPLLHRHLMLHQGIADRLIDETVRRWQASRQY